MEEIRAAVKISCKDFLESKYIKGSGWEPGWLEYNNKKVRKVNIVGFLVYEGDGFIVIDDGSGSVYINTLNVIKMDKLSPGDAVMVIGSPRSYENRNYVSAEIVTKIRKEWVTIRKGGEEASLQLEEEKKEVIAKPPEEFLNIFNKETIIKELIKEMDSNSGIEVEELIKKAKEKGVEEKDSRDILLELLKRGEIYEIRPGFIRPL